MQPLEGDEEEVKEGTGLKIFTPNKLLARLSNIIKTNKNLETIHTNKKRNKTHTVSFVPA